MPITKDAYWLKKEVKKLVDKDKYDDAREMAAAYKDLDGVNLDRFKLRINLAENEKLLDNMGITF